MKSIGNPALLLPTILLISAFMLPAKSEGQPPFPDIASSEIWIDGPDAVQPGGPGVSDVAVDDKGTRIHVWVAFDVIDRNDVYLRRFDAAGNPLEDPTRVNTTIESDQHYPRVAVSADGSFLVIFQSFEGSQYTVRSQAYDANGDPVGSEQLVSTVPTGDQVSVYADVAALRGAGGNPGGYAVVWYSNQSSGSDSNLSIEGAVVSAAGVPGGQFQVNSTSGGAERWPSVTELKDGGFLSVWIEVFSGEVRGRHFSSAGGAIGPEFQINSFDNALAGSWTDAAIGWNGNVLVVWEDGGSEDPPLNSNGEIRGRWLDDSLNGMGSDFRINNLFEGIQDYPRVAEFGPKGFLVFWSSDTVSAGPDTTQSIEARVVSGPNAFDHDGDGMDDPQVQYNVWDNDAGQNYPGSHGWYGRLATTWQSNTWDGEPPPDTINQLFLIGRNIEHCIFCTDMEWFSPGGNGNLWRWSKVVE